MKKSYIYLFGIVVSLAIMCFFFIRKDRESWLNKTIVFPQSLLVLDDYKFYSSDVFLGEVNTRPIVISIVDASCMKCVVTNINITDSIFYNAFKVNEVVADLVFVLNISKGDSALFLSNIYPNLKVKGTILWDNSFQFETVNNLFTSEMSDRTLLVDANDRVRLVGSPLYNSGILEEYIEIINGE